MRTEEIRKNCFHGKDELILKGVADTQNLASDISKQLVIGDVVALKGDLGTGKTTFTKALLSTLGVDEAVVSPTYSIVNTYRGDRCIINHFDVYRLHGSDEFYAIGGDEYFNDESISIIEWAEKIEDALPSDAIYLEMKYSDDDNERICSCGYWQ